MMMMMMMMMVVVVVMMMMMTTMLIKKCYRLSLLGRLLRRKGVPVSCNASESLSVLRIYISTFRLRLRSIFYTWSCEVCEI
jgi:hypothetical protein